MSSSVVCSLRMIVLSAVVWVSGTNVGSSATITQATVATDVPSQTFDFEIVWSGPPNFITTDSFKYNILNPTIAGNCCSPFGGWAGFAANNADYQLIEDAGILSLYSGNDNGRALIGPVSFNLASSVLTFAIAFSQLTEPNGFVYELEHYLSGSFDGVVLVGSSNGLPATVPSVPLPAALPLFATGLGVLGLLGWRRKRKNAAAIAAA
jgi:hypothetical protein